MAGNPNDVEKNKASTLRRSQRVVLDVDVDVTLQCGNGIEVPERTNTLLVSAHGALLVLKTPVAVGDLLALRNVRTQEEVDCRVVDISGKKLRNPQGRRRIPGATEEILARGVSARGLVPA